MRTWNNKLCFDAIPGRAKAGLRQGDFEGWLEEMREHEIEAVVCLAPDEQIAAESPEYARWREHQRFLGTVRKHGVWRYHLIDLPVNDFCAPDPVLAERFWEVAEEIAFRTNSGERVFIHCGAGIGRTGMFAVAVLMALGFSYDDAYREIEKHDSYPEMPEQRSFLQRGPINHIVAPQNHVSAPNDATMVDDFISIEQKSTATVIWVIKIRWDGPATPLSDWRVAARLPATANSDQIDARIRDILNNPIFFSVCTECGERNPRGWMHDSDICQGCAQQNHGVVY